MTYHADLHLTGNDDVDALLSSDPNALLIGMVLDQQVTMEKAFTGPSVIAGRMGGQFDVRAIADLPVDDFVDLCTQRPAVHRFPGAMGARVHEVCQVLVRDYDGDAGALLAGADSGQQLKKLISGLPGFGATKTSILIALLGKQCGITPPGWQEVAGSYGADGEYRSVADITDAESLLKVRETKKAAKARARAAADQD